MKRCRKFAAVVCLAWLTVWNTGCSDGNPEIYGVIHGIVTDFETGVPVANADVTLAPSSQVKTTDKNGTFHFDNLDSRQYTVSVICHGYQANSRSANAIAGEDIQVDISLIPINNNE